jgi:hypothetical protein
MQSRVKQDLSCGRIMVQDQRPGVVEQNFARHTAEGTESTLHAVEPVILLLVAVGADMQAARVAQRCYEQVDFDHRATDLYPAFTEVDL